MSKKLKAETQKAVKTEKPKVKTIAKRSKKVTIFEAELNTLVEKRAYELFLERAGACGDASDDWYKAEQEIRAKVKITKK